MKTFLFVFLIIGNIVLFCILGAVYFFGFDIQWGMNWQAVTWGIPLLVAIAFVIFCIVKSFRNTKLRWAISGIGVAVIVLVYSGLVFWFYGHLLVSAPISGPKETLDTEENRILSQVLTTFFSDERGYVVIHPETYPQWMGLSDGDKFIEDVRGDLKRDFLSDGESVEEIEEIIESVKRLYDDFVELNKQETRLSIKSSHEDGYYIDYDGIYSRYFSDQFGGGWLRMRMFRHNVGPYVEVSLPAYDPDTGVVIIYLGMSFDYLVGFGDIWVMKYENDILTPITGYEIWIS